MAHWAKINEDGIVENVIVTSNENIDEGQSWIAENLDGVWVKTSYNTRKNKHLLGGAPLRKNFAEVGGRYDSELDAFIPPRKEGEENFILDELLGIWVPGVPSPEDADFVMIYGAEPDMIEKQIEIDGQLVTTLDYDIPEGSKVYFWMPEQQVWGMMPDSENPDGSHKWNYIEKKWESDTVSRVARPSLEHHWNPFESEWQVPSEPKPDDNVYWNFESEQWLPVEEMRPSVPSETQEWPSWTEGEDGLWHPPVEMPKDGGRYTWDEVAGNWHKVA